ncbi:NAD(P)-dependent oxidoreductase [Kitasatospora aureofaciens]|uniref:NAD(P)-dependent oxidoreductase n=1 Tax=Kitasatospora aureofaciens TaxID=1894 RepID=UPI0038197742
MRAPTILVAKGAGDPNALLRSLSRYDVYEFASLDELGGAVRRAELIVIRSGVQLDAARLADMPKLRHVIRAGSGLDGIDTALLAARGIGLHRYPEASAPAVAEWCLAALLALARRIPLGANGLALGGHLKTACLGTPVVSMRVAVWGAGPIGRAAAAVTERFGAEVAFAARPSITDGLPQMPASELPGWADAHIVALPATAENTGAFGTGFLRSASGRRPLLVVVGRLATIDPAACLEALADGRLSGLAVDPIEATDAHLFRAGSAPLNLLATPRIGAQRADVRAALDAWVTQMALTVRFGPTFPARVGPTRGAHGSVRGLFRLELAPPSGEVWDARGRSP